MKQNDIVSLINLEPNLIAKNLYKNANGVILKILPYNKSLVLFLNDNIIGDFAVIEVNNSNLKLEKEKLPTNLIHEITNKNSKEDLLKKQSFKKLTFNECDVVELIKEEEKYTSLGIHKGAVGVIAIDYAVNDSILVDFSGLDENGNFCGDCISVKVNDLKIIKKIDRT